MRSETDSAYLRIRRYEPTRPHRVAVSISSSLMISSPILSARLRFGIVAFLFQLHCPYLIDQ